MSIAIALRPVVDDSVVSGANSPVVYKLQRKDFAYNQVNNSSGKVQLQFNAVNLVASFNVNDTIYFRGDNGSYGVLAKVTARAFSTNTLVTLDTAYSVASPGGFVNSFNQRSDYHVLISAVNIDGVQLMNKLRVSPDKTGLMLVDISAISNTLDPAIDLYTNNSAHQELNVFKQLKITYQEVWRNSANSINTDSVVIGVVLGANQIPSQFGGNLKEHVVQYAIASTTIFDDTNSFNTKYSQSGAGLAWSILSPYMLFENLAEPATSKLVKRLASIKKGRKYIVSGNVQNSESGSNLKLYLKYGTASLLLGTFLVDDVANFTQSFIADDNYSFVELYAVINTNVDNTFTLSRVTISEELEPKFLTKLTEPTQWIGWPFSVSALLAEDGITASLHSDNGLVTDNFSSVEGPTMWNLSASGFPNPDASKYTIWLVNSDTNNVISELKTIKLEEACLNPIMLACRNTLGGILQWVFNGKQSYTFDYGNGRKAKRLILGASALTLNEWEALQDFVSLNQLYDENITEFTPETIKTSSRVGHQVYEVKPDGSKIGVIVIPRTNTTTVGVNGHYFEIEIEYPSMF